eukprot:CAMPEP_0182533142 /NCGR_PEP_ID=MMETSP1323-20130603/13181_1 /TAXON_ID=236787 /ORGANISM="Florenciella parvula, Strain RCC1693" /LENGTH=62 /DNA_ID=CAMNT_0024742991 /DNA_START=312 /DNA_END=497 /DNA_ORIENTATION=+
MNSIDTTPRNFMVSSTTAPDSAYTGAPIHRPATTVPTECCKMLAVLSPGLPPTTTIFHVRLA